MPKIPIYAKVAFLVCIIIGFACCTAIVSNPKSEPSSSSNEEVKDSKKIIEDKSVSSSMKDSKKIIEDKSVKSSMKDYVLDGEKLTVYTNVPGHEKSVIKNYPSRAKSDIYEIRVRSAATKNEWVPCFTNMTYNRALEMPKMEKFKTNTASHAYQLATKGWTHSYANIEISENSPIEVEIRKIGNTTLNGTKGIVKANVHPAQKILPGSKQVKDGCVYFKIDRPGQIVIDINGQMDDHNAAFPSGTPGGAMAGNPPVHTVALYANPILPKPATSGESIRFVTAGTPPATDTNYTTLVFGPGVHDIGEFIVHPGKSYYIPGDAIIYGSINNTSEKGKFRSSGDSIHIYGYGTISGIKTPHYQNKDNNPEYPEWNDGDKSLRGGDVALVIRNAWDVKINGITIIDPANFNTRIDGQHKRTNDQSLMSWVKLHSWRVNGDGCGGYIKLEDSFLRTSDDSTYVRDWRRRCTFWKDSNANQFRFVNHIAGGVEDCDILYSRWRDKRGVGSIFEFATSAGAKVGVRPLSINIKNNRFHDKFLCPRHIIYLNTKETLLGVTFEDMTFYTSANKQKSVLMGSQEAPYKGRIMFKNIKFQNGLDGSPPVHLNKTNYKMFFETNEYVDQSVFEDPK